MTAEVKPDEATPSIELQLGKRISQFRSGKGITQDRLALLTGFTKGYLSKIENSKVIPPIGTLAKIAKILDTDVVSFLEPEASNEDSQICIVRSWQRDSVNRSGTPFGYDFAALANKRHHKKMDPLIMHFPSEIKRDVRFEHAGEEFMFVLSGEIEFEAIVNGRTKTWILATGDSVYFDARTPHRGRGLQDNSRALVVAYRPITADLP